MNNFDFALRALVSVLKPKRDGDDKVVRDDDGAVVKVEHQIPGVVRGRLVVTDTFLAITNEVGAEIGRVVVTEGVLDVVEGEADPDKAVRMSPSGGVPTETGKEPEGKKVPELEE